MLVRISPVSLPAEVFVQAKSNVHLRFAVGVVVHHAKSVTSVRALTQIFWDPLIGIATRLRSEQLRIRRSIPVRGRYFSFLYSVFTGCGAHPSSYSLGIAGASPGVKQLGRECDHSSPSIAFTASCTEKNVASSVFVVT